MKILASKKHKNIYGGQMAGAMFGMGAANQIEAEAEERRKEEEAKKKAEEQEKDL